MTVFTEARYGFNWNYAVGDAGWGPDYNFTHRALGTVICAYLISDTVTAPPSAPGDGDSYWVPTAPTGIWVGQTNKIAAYQGGAWQFYIVPRGFRCYIASRTAFYWWTGTALQAEISSATAGVTSVAGRAGAVTLSSTDIVDFTAAIDTLLAIGGDGKIGWTVMKPEVQNQPIAFVIQGKPAAGQVYNIPMVQAVTIPANFVGTKGFAGTLPVSNATFTLNKISAGVTSAIGTVVKTTTNGTSLTLSVQAAVSLAVGDVLQLVAPTVQDSTMAEIGITVLAAKV